jgi:8-oxo-dGTP pyrophosphatase MutT (NUDIX family)
MKSKIINLFYNILRIYWRIRKPITLGVRIIAVNEHGEILLVKHTYQNNWFLPGGGVKKGETFEQTIRRELIEETGYEADVIELFGVYNNTYEGKRDNIVVFISRNGKFVEVSKSPEIEKYEFFNPNNLPENTAKGMRRRIEEFFNSDKSSHYGIW